MLLAVKNILITGASRGIGRGTAIECARQGADLALNCSLKITSRPCGFSSICFSQPCWFHRTLHRTPFLWAHHKMHHMDPELEAITLVRQNWIEVFIGALFVTLPLTIFFNLDDLDPWPLGLLTGSVLTVVTTLLGIGHLNVRWQMGRASLFFCSPQMHRIHHSPLPRHHDRNFAFALPLWDVIFGTYYAPSRDEFPPSGVDGEKEITSFIEAQTLESPGWLDGQRPACLLRQEDRFGLMIPKCRGLRSRECPRCPAVFRKESRNKVVTSR